ncbi:MAG: DMT family transporter [Lachnospiraceae bacterium]|nr:DMT family transporter [Lachnospiraceae bacterium]
MKTNWKNPILLIVAAAIWGFAFAFQSVGMDYLEPFTFNCIRNVIGALVLVPVVLVMDQSKKKEIQQNKDIKQLILGGICCGVILFISSGSQQIGIQYTTVGKAGFITALYIVIVPLLGIILGKKSRLLLWISVLVSVVGFYFLTMIGESSFTKGDVWVLLCAFVFACHILCVDYFAPKVDCVKMSCIQFAVCGFLSGIAMVLTETPSLENISHAMVPLLYTGIMSSGVAFTFQILGQKNYNPTIAALLMSLESVFAVIGGWIILKQSLSITEGFGCVLIFIGIILAQLPEKKVNP